MRGRAGRGAPPATYEVRVLVHLGGAALGAHEQPAVLGAGERRVGRPVREDVRPEAGRVAKIAQDVARAASAVASLKRRQVVEQVPERGEVS